MWQRQTDEQIVVCTRLSSYESLSADANVTLTIATFGTEE